MFHGWWWIDCCSIYIYMGILAANIWSISKDKIWVVSPCLQMQCNMFFLKNFLYLINKDAYCSWSADADTFVCQWFFLQIYLAPTLLLLLCLQIPNIYLILVRVIGVSHLLCLWARGSTCLLNISIHCFN